LCVFPNGLAVYKWNIVSISVLGDDPVLPSEQHLNVLTDYVSFLESWSL